MGLAFHELFSVDGMSGFTVADRVYFARKDVVYGAGAGAGSLVSTTVTWTEPVPTPYAVLIGLPEDGVAFVTTKTTTSFVLGVNPRLAANTVAGGTANCVIIS